MVGRSWRDADERRAAAGTARSLGSSKAEFISHSCYRCGAGLVAVDVPLFCGEAIATGVFRPLYVGRGLTQVLGCV